MDELRRRARRPRREVVALDECDREAVARGQLGHAGADDPAADDEQVEAFRPQPLEARRARVVHHPRLSLSVGANDVRVLPTARYRHLTRCCHAYGTRTP
jgi:hypothetical protein